MGPQSSLVSITAGCFGGQSATPVVNRPPLLESLLRSRQTTPGRLTFAGPPTARALVHPHQSRRPRAPRGRDLSTSVVQLVTLCSTRRLRHSRACWSLIDAILAGRHQWCHRTDNPLLTAGSGLSALTADVVVEVPWRLRRRRCVTPPFVAPTGCTIALVGTSPPAGSVRGDHRGPFGLC